MTSTDLRYKIPRPRREPVEIQRGFQPNTGEARTLLTDITLSSPVRIYGGGRVSYRKGCLMLDGETIRERRG